MPDATRNEMPSIRARVLIVDDDESMRASLSLILEYGNFEVATAASVNDALNIDRVPGLRCASERPAHAGGWGRLNRG